ncbi:hypothetical protein JCGZ_04181 [Jatropha curcas]|uniref:Uncharacterized protein n=1 Tax=Jatropha curcas TaxID=180498 RepID=A0A067KUF4_JATCU|nr:hypothetical protein JCGZ_04181 [Jatropha curcas]
MLGLFVVEARELVVDNQVELAGLLDTARLPRLGPLETEQGAVIASMALAETIISLDRAYRVDGIWSASPILLQHHIYVGPRLMRQMGHVQGLPSAGALFRDILISPKVTVAILGS